MKYKNIKQIHEEDQKQRGEAQKKVREHWDGVKPMFETFADDQKRLAAAKYFLQTGQLKTAEDFLYASFIFHHSEFAPEYLALAVMCSQIAMEMGHAKGKWLYARTLDRFYAVIGIPQKFGTQPGVISNKTSDEERAEYGVKPLQELLEDESKSLETTDQEAQ